MSDIRRGTPVDTDCGDVFKIEDQEASVIWTRKHTGTVAKTTEAANRSQCKASARYYAEVADGVYVAACSYHVDKLEDGS